VKTAATESHHFDAAELLDALPADYPHLPPKKEQQGVIVKLEWMD
jgi:hypothetical protein